MDLVTLLFDLYFHEGKAKIDVVVLYNFVNPYRRRALITENAQAKS